MAPHVHRAERTTSNIGRASPQIVQRNTELEQENIAPNQLDDSDTAIETVQLAPTAKHQKRQENTKNNRTALAKSIASTTKTITQIWAQSVEQQKEERSADEYRNKEFVMSFIPIIGNLPTDVQMQAQFNIAQVFNDYSYICVSPST